MPFTQYPAPTSGTGVATKVALNQSAVTLSLSGTTTALLTATAKDAAGTIQTGVVLTLSAVANAASGTTVYTGTITNGGTNAFAGYTFTIAGFTTGANNGTFACAASSGTTLTLENTAGVAETHAATATADDMTAFKFVSNNPSVATVNAAGLVTAVKKGEAFIEVSLPVNNNTHGLANSGHYADKIYGEAVVRVRA